MLRIAERHKTTALGICVLFIFCFSLIGKLIYIRSSIPSGADLGKLRFGFGGYVETLANTGSFAACPSPTCFKSSRMPLIPVIYAFFKRHSCDQRSTALIKAIALSSICFVAAVSFLRLHRSRSQPALALIAAGMLLIFLSPLVIKNSSEIAFEEGILTETSFLLVLSALVLLHSAPQSWEGTLGGLGAISCSSIGYLAKSSMVCVHLTVLLMVLSLARSKRMRRSTAILLAGVGIAPLGAWGLHNYFAAGHVSVGSSYDGENLFRGWNETSYRIYPYVNLDRVIDSRVVNLRNGAQIENGEFGKAIPAFANEWEWSRYYRRRAIEWFVGNPGRDISLLGRKVYVMLIGIGRYPSVEGRQYGVAALAASMLWMAMARCGTAGVVILGILLWISRRWKPGAADGWILAILSSYCLPYVLGFAYQRHSVPLLVMALAYCSFRASDWMEPAVQSRPAVRE